MYTTDYIRLEQKARENWLTDELQAMCEQAQEETITQFGTFEKNGDGEIISTTEHPVDAYMANLMEAEHLETLINDHIYNNWISRVYGSIACFNGDPFVCDDMTIIEEVASTIYECGLRHVADSIEAFDDALKKLGLDDEKKYAVSAIYETPHKELTICLNEDLTLL